MVRLHGLHIGFLTHRGRPTGIPSPAWRLATAATGVGGLLTIERASMHGSARALAKPPPCREEAAGVARTYRRESRRLGVGGASGGVCVQKCSGLPLTLTGKSWRGLTRLVTAFPWKDGTSHLHLPPLPQPPRWSLVTSSRWGEGNLDFLRLALTPRNYCYSFTPPKNHI